MVFFPQLGAASETGIDLGDSHPSELSGKDLTVADQVGDGTCQSSVHKMVLQDQDILGFFDAP